MIDQEVMPTSGEPAAEWLFSIVYASAATGTFTEADLAVLLAVSRLNNQASGLTGVLLYRSGQFMQALEGPEHTVRATLATIAADPRHTGIWTLHEATIPHRHFGTWAMGYRSLTDADVATAPQWFGTPDALRERTSDRTSELLTWFYRH